jgi:hypothetical protein
MVERWCDAWALEAAGRGLPKDGDYWELGEAWIADRRRAGVAVQPETPL